MQTYFDKSKVKRKVKVK